MQDHEMDSEGPFIPQHSPNFNISSLLSHPLYQLLWPTYQSIFYPVSNRIPSATALQSQLVSYTLFRYLHIDPRSNAMAARAVDPNTEQSLPIHVSPYPKFIHNFASSLRRSIDRSRSSRSPSPSRKDNRNVSKQHKRNSVSATRTTNPQTQTTNDQVLKSRKFSPSPRFPHQVMTLMMLCHLGLMQYPKACQTIEFTQYMHEIDSAWNLTRFVTSNKPSEAILQQIGMASLENPTTTETAISNQHHVVGELLRDDLNQTSSATDSDENSSTQDNNEKSIDNQTSQSTQLHRVSRRQKIHYQYFAPLLDRILFGILDPNKAVLPYFESMYIQESNVLNANKLPQTAAVSNSASSPSQNLQSMMDQVQKLLSERMMSEEQIRNETLKNPNRKKRVFLTVKKDFSSQSYLDQHGPQSKSSQFESIDSSNAPASLVNPPFQPQSLNRRLQPYHSPRHFWLLTSCRYHIFSSLLSRDRYLAKKTQPNLRKLALPPASSQNDSTTEQDAAVETDSTTDPTTSSDPTYSDVISVFPPDASKQLKLQVATCSMTPTNPIAASFLQSAGQSISATGTTLSPHEKAFILPSFDAFNRYDHFHSKECILDSTSNAVPHVLDISTATFNRNNIDSPLAPISPTQMTPSSVVVSCTPEKPEVWSAMTLALSILNARVLHQYRPISQVSHVPIDDSELESPKTPARPLLDAFSMPVSPSLQVLSNIASATAAAPSPSSDSSLSSSPSHSTSSAKDSSLSSPSPSVILPAYVPNPNWLPQLSTPNTGAQPHVVFVERMLLSKLYSLSTQNVTYSQARTKCKTAFAVLPTMSSFYDEDVYEYLLRNWQTPGNTLYLPTSRQVQDLVSFDESMRSYLTSGASQLATDALPQCISLPHFLSYCSNRTSSLSPPASDESTEVTTSKSFSFYITQLYQAITHHSIIYPYVSTPTSPLVIYHMIFDMDASPYVWLPKALQSILSPLSGRSTFKNWHQSVSQREFFNQIRNGKTKTTDETSSPSATASSSSSDTSSTIPQQETEQSTNSTTPSSKSTTAAFADTALFLKFGTTMSTTSTTSTSTSPNQFNSPFPLGQVDSVMNQVTTSVNGEQQSLQSSSSSSSSSSASASGCSDSANQPQQPQQQQRSSDDCKTLISPSNNIVGNNNVVGNASLTTTSTSLQDLPSGDVSFNLLWSWRHSSISHTHLHAMQRVNHFQRSAHLTRKDGLYNNLVRYFTLMETVDKRVVSKRLQTEGIFTMNDLTQAIITSREKLLNDDTIMGDDSNNNSSSSSSSMLENNTTIASDSLLPPTILAMFPSKRAAVASSNSTSTSLTTTSPTAAGTTSTSSVEPAVLDHVFAALRNDHCDALPPSLQSMSSRLLSPLLDIMPKSYVLPADLARFNAEYTQRQAFCPHCRGSGLRNNDTTTTDIQTDATTTDTTSDNAPQPCPCQLWIIKPVNSSRGRGISLSSDIKTDICDPYNELYQDLIHLPPQEFQAKIQQRLQQTAAANAAANAAAATTTATTTTEPTTTTTPLTKTPVKSILNAKTIEEIVEPPPSPDDEKSKASSAIEKIADTTSCPSVVVQHYVHNPLLLHKRKFDLRIYVVVLSFEPLEAYVYNEGFARYAGTDYDMENINNIHAHLTNSSINLSFVQNEQNQQQISKQQQQQQNQTAADVSADGVDDNQQSTTSPTPDPCQNEDDIDNYTPHPSFDPSFHPDKQNTGTSTFDNSKQLMSEWMLDIMHSYPTCSHNEAIAQTTGNYSTSTTPTPKKLDMLQLWRDIDRIILTSLIAVAARVGTQSNAFELFGYDIMMDDEYRPWLLEVNSSPSLNLNTDIDVLVKPHLLADTFGLLGLLPFDRSVAAGMVKDLLYQQQNETTDMNSESSTTTNNGPIGKLYASSKDDSKRTVGDLETITRLASQMQLQHASKRTQQALDGTNQTYSELLANFRPRLYGELPVHIGNFRRLAPNGKNSLFGQLERLRTTIQRCHMKPITPLSLIKKPSA